jgi:hypothetical protein
VDSHRDTSEIAAAEVTGAELPCNPLRDGKFLQASHAGHGIYCFEFLAKKRGDLFAAMGVKPRPPMHPPRISRL